MKHLSSNRPRTITPIYGLCQDFTDLACLPCVNLLESQGHGLTNSMKVPHTYSVSQPLPSYVHLCMSRHPKNTRTYESIAELDNFYALHLRAKVLESLRYGGIKSMLVRHAYSVSQPLPSYVRLCGSRHPKNTRTYESIAELDHFYALHLRQSAGITEVWRNQVHAGTPRIFCLTTPSLTCIYPYIIWVRIDPKKLHDT